MTVVPISRRRVLAGAGGVAALLAGGFGYQTVSNGMDRREHPPPGDLVDVGTHRLHLHARGEAGDDPTVVIEAGSGAWSLDWHRVGADLASRTRVVTYDRAGYGWSDPGPTPRTARRIADELLRALSTAGVDGPYVLVGHSFGGYTPRLLAETVPDQVAGIALIDARQEDVGARLPAELTEGNPPLGLLETLARFGVVDLSIDVWGDDAPGLPPLDAIDPDVRDAYVAIGFQPSYFRAVADEGAVIEESDEQVRAAGSLGDLPLTVVSHDVPDLFAGLPDERSTEAERVWQEGQRELAGLSTNGTRLVARSAGHNVQFDRPELVVQSVRRLVDGDGAT